MMMETNQRHIRFEGILNFRDLGGYKARGGRSIARGRVFRSSEFAGMTRNDLALLTGEIGLASVIDLRSASERERQGIGLLSETGIKFRNISFLADGGGSQTAEIRSTDFPDMGEFYVYLVRRQQFGRKIIEALEIIADSANHPLVFHCAVGKDRTGMLAAMLLGALGVADEDIVADYALSGLPMQLIIRRLSSKPETAIWVERIPAFAWEAVPESMARLLDALRKDYGSTEGYLKENGADPKLVTRLEKALLV